MPTVPLCPLFLCAYCSSDPSVPLWFLFLCAHCSSVPTVPLCLLFLCAYCCSVPTVPLCPLFLCAHCFSVPSAPLFLCAYNIFRKTTGTTRFSTKNNIKVSYSCTDNLKTIIKKHNRNILETSKTPSTENNCNCRKRNDCPLQKQLPHLKRRLQRQRNNRK